MYLGDAQTGLEGWGRLLDGCAIGVTRRSISSCSPVTWSTVVTSVPTGIISSFEPPASSIGCRSCPAWATTSISTSDRGFIVRFFELPRNGPRGIAADLAYHFEAGDACFAVLDSTLAAYDARPPRRRPTGSIACLHETKATWKFVMLHHPIYPSHPWRDIPALRERLVPIFDKHHVDFVLQGHDHAYQRTYPMRGHARAERPPTARST